MRVTLTMAVLAASVATVAPAKTTTMHHHRMTDTGSSDAVKALNEKSLQQASAGGSMNGQSMTPSPSMSGSGNGMSAAPAAPLAPTDAAPMMPHDAATSGSTMTSPPNAPQ